MTSKPQHAPWTPDEDAKLLRMQANGVSIQNIASVIGRSHHAIYARWARIGDGEELTGERLACANLLAALARHHKPGCGELNVPNENRPMIVTPIASRSYLGSSAAMCAEWGR